MRAVNVYKFLRLRLPPRKRKKARRQVRQGDKATLPTYINSLKFLLDDSADGIPRSSSFLPPTVESRRRKAIGVRRRFLLFPIHSGGWIGAGEDGERGLRWPLYILLLSLSSLGLGSVPRVEATLRRRSNFLQLLRLVGTCSSASEGIAGSGDLDVSDLVRFSSAPSLVSVGAAAGDGFGSVRSANKNLLSIVGTEVGFKLQTLTYFFFNLWFVRDASCGCSDHRRRDDHLAGTALYFYFLQGCLCKIWNVNFMKYL
ncbi:uncharacterized protein LOC112873309 [Panicum hallii]|uniref:uncharacterized protein LOC112873309 n=1 Tax=Panicum hallii TaxID=206008 RepID=UPI000DF4D1AB|nr:uncharacterized protein LOC112873309 [Panicum hallii]